MISFPVDNPGEAQMSYRSIGMAICLVAAATAGCGTAHASQPGTLAAKQSPASRTVVAGTAAPASCQHPAGKSLVLTMTSKGKTICVRVGTRLEVILHGTRSQPWKEPVATGHVLTGVPNGAFSLPVGITAASYAAARPGQSLIVSIRPPCQVPVKNEAQPAFPLPGPYPTRLCSPDRVFVVTIIVLRT
jgi:hypothetical protein